MCQYCESPERIKYYDNVYGDLYIGKFGTRKTLEIDITVCPPYAKCSRKGMNIRAVYPIKFCPECGADLRQQS